MKRKKVQPMGESTKMFYCGFAAAVGSLARECDEPTLAVTIMHNNGVSLDVLRQAGVPNFDLKPLRREWKLRNRASTRTVTP